MTCTEDRFLKDVSEHEMTIIRDADGSRHIRFRKPRPAGSEYWFDLITWPGALCIDGDMGTYVFKRLDDMFEFFRTDREYALSKGFKLGINRGYWSEKLVAPKSDQAQEFDAEKFRQMVRSKFDQWVSDNQPDEDEPDELKNNFSEKKTELWEQLESEVLSSADDGATRSYDAAMGFRFEGGFELNDSWEWNCREYKFHFIWCCYAIAWGIQKYDEAKK